MKKKKIVFCLSHIMMGGVEKILCQYLMEMKKHPEFDLVVLSKRPVTDSYFIDFFRQHNIRLIDDKNREINFHPHFFMWKILMKPVKIFTRYLSGYKRFFKSADVIIDFCNFSFENELRNVPRKKIVWCHGSILFFNRNNLIEKLNTYDKMVCLSENFKNDFIATYPDAADKIVHICNPLDIESVRQNAATRPAPKSKYFVHVSRLDGIDKDVETVIRAFNIFSESNKNTKLYIVGDGAQKPALEHMAANNPNIIFTGTINEPYYMISGAMALILSSATTIGEGLGLVLMEAQALGTLAISSDVPSGPAEILMNGDAGILFKPRNINQLAQIMTDIDLAPDKHMDKIHVATRNLDRYDAQQLVKKLIKLIQEK